MKRRSPFVLISCLVLASCVAPVPWDEEVQTFGALRAMFHDDQTGPMVNLGQLLPAADLYGVGALADLAGEVTIVGGKAYLSYPEGDSARTETVSTSEEAATLLVVTRVPGWRRIVTKAPIRYDEIDEKIGELAAAAGMDVDRRLPFLLEGEFEDLQWHVIDGRRLAAGGTSHEDHLGSAVKLKRDRASATLIGFYSNKDQGVFTHMGSVTHIHCVLEDPISAGHVDHVTIPAGTTVKFPARAKV